MPVNDSAQGESPPLRGFVCATLGGGTGERKQPAPERLASWRRRLWEPWQRVPGTQTWTGDYPQARPYHGQCPGVKVLKTCKYFDSSILAKLRSLLKTTEHILIFLNPNFCHPHLFTPLYFSTMTLLKRRHNSKHQVHRSTAPNRPRRTRHQSEFRSNPLRPKQHK